jgi:hypothetical protein
MPTPGLGRAKLGVFASHLETKMTQGVHLTIVLKKSGQIDQSSQAQPLQTAARKEI